MIYVLHFDPAYRHARHYVGFAEDHRVGERVREQLGGLGRRPSPLVRAAVAAGCRVVLAATLPGTRDDERALKRRHGAGSFCPLCRAGHNERARLRMREVRARDRGDGGCAGGRRAITSSARWQPSAERDDATTC